MSKKSISNKAQALLDAHVAFVIEEVTGKGFPKLIKSQVTAFLDDVGPVKLNDVVSADQIRETARKYAADMKLSGAIPELVGDIARRIYSHAAEDDTTLNELVSDKQFSEFLDKALEMKELRERIIHEVISSPVYEALVSDITYYGVRGYMAENPLTKGIPGAQSMMKLGKSMMSKASLDKTLEENLKKYIRKNVRPLLKESENFLKKRMKDEVISDAAQEIWGHFKSNKLSMFADYISSRDVEEIFVIGLEYWKSLRKTPYYGNWIDMGVDFFFEKYGDASLQEILDEMGVTRDMIIDDAQRFAPGAVKALQENGLLDKLVRRQLERFYQSDAAARILDGE